MPVKLISGRERIADLLGVDFLDHLTYPAIFRHAPESVLPVVVVNGDQQTVVIAMSDSTACNRLDPPLPKAVYGRYFIWGGGQEPSAASFADAVRGPAGAETIEVSSDLPAARFKDLEASGPVRLAEAGPPLPRVFVHAKPRGEIEAQWRSTRDADALALRPFVQTLSHADALITAMSDTIPGFEVLDELAAAAGLAALLVSSPHEVEMFSGLPAARNAELRLRALYRPGATEILLLCENPAAEFGQAVQENRPLADVLREVGDGPLGVQREVMPISEWLALEQAGLALTPGSPVLQRWQDRRAGGDLPYYILAGNAVLAGIRAVRDWQETGSAAPTTERALVAIFDRSAREFAAEYGLEDRLGPYFSLAHSGARTLLPAPASDYPVHPQDRTIKFDMGFAVTDGAGCVRAVSDIARTLCADPALAALHERLRDALVHGLIPAIRPGMSGAEVHARGIDCLRPLEPEFRRLGLLPADKTVADYTRDCGHAMQRTTISSVYFLPNVTSTLTAGMIGCVEYVWPIGDVLLAVEDSFLITKDGAIPITD